MTLPTRQRGPRVRALAVIIASLAAAAGCERAAAPDPTVVRGQESPSATLEFEKRFAEADRAPRRIDSAEPRRRLRDPFAVAGPAAAPATTAPARSSKAAVRPGAMVLQGVMAWSGRRVALINGASRRVGDALTVAGRTWVVTAIDPEAKSVTVTHTRGDGSTETRVLVQADETAAILR